MNALFSVASQFAAGSSIRTISALGNGLINDTYRVDSEAGAFVLQRINRHVFPQPAQVMANLQHLAAHVAAKSDAQLQIPAVLPATDGLGYFRDQAGDFWRGLQLIETAESRERIDNHEQARQIGWALGHFHRLCSDLPIENMYDTLPGFHDTPTYYRQYQTLLDEPPQVAIDDDYRFCQDFIEKNAERIDWLQAAKKAGMLKLSVSHGDPKLNNFLFAVNSNRVVSLIDLDTVKPGLWLHDIGDCLRSCCQDRASGRFDLALCEPILTAYLQEVGDILPTEDHKQLFAATWLIPFELGLRFFSDYLAGDLYFKTQRPGQNLQRALTQFALCQSIEQQKAEFERLLSAARTK